MIYWNVEEGSHFEEQLDKRTDPELVDDPLPELDSLTYDEVAEPLMDSTVEVVLESGNRYREVTQRGITYGVGYKRRGNTIYPATFITPEMVKSNRAMKRRGTFRGTIKTVEAFR